MNDFYEKCAEILGVEYDGKPFTHYKRTRWNNRSPGSGRYPGYGIIRVFGDKIHGRTPATGFPSRDLWKQARSA